MSLLFNAVQANPQQSFFAAFGSGGGGSYPRDASFNSIVIDPSGIASPLTIGPGTGGNVLGIRRTEVGVPTDYILFDPTETSMALSNVSTINGFPYNPVGTLFDFSNYPGGTPVVEAPAWGVLNTLNFTAPADGKLYVETLGTYVALVSGAGVAMTVAVDGSNVPQDPVITNAYAGNTNVFNTCMVQFPVDGGTTYAITSVAHCSAIPPADPDIVVTSSRMFAMFSPL
jgi:hypothetical protein